MFGKSVIGGEQSFDHKLLIAKLYQATSLTTEEKDHISNILLSKEQVSNEFNVLSDQYSPEQIKILQSINK